MKKIIILHLLLNITKLFAQQAGTLDNTFGVGGLVTTDFIGDFNEAFSVVVQPDNKIIVAGYGLNITSFDFELVRYNTDGTLDETFGEAGKVITDLGGSDQINSMLLQADGKILVAGRSVNTNYYFALARYNTDGILDNTFGTNGTVITDVTTGSDVASSVGITPNQKILVAGYSFNGTERDIILVQYNMNGTLDTTFCAGGKLVSNITEREQVNALLIQPDGKIIVAGEANYTYCLIRYNSDGTFDNSFGINGIVITNMGSNLFSVARSIAIQPDGKIVVAGDIENGPFSDVALARYNIDGTLDDTFDFDGKVITNVGSGYDYANSLTLQPDGKILVAGSTAIDTVFFPNSKFLLLRYNQDGSLDESFGINGASIDYIGMTDNFLHSVVMQPDGKILVAGMGDLGISIGFDFVIMRYLSDLNVGILDFIKPQNSVLIYPNPINSELHLKYTIGEMAMISINITDTQGKLISEIISNQRQDTGLYEQIIPFPENLPSGVYYINIVSPKGRISTQILK